MSKTRASLKPPLLSTCSDNSNLPLFLFSKEVFIPVFSLVFLAIVAIIFMSAVKTVPEGMEYTVERFGRYTKTLGPGLAVVTPFIDRIGYKVNMRERKVPVEFKELKTKDNAEINGSADIYLSVTDTYKLAYETGDSDASVRQKCEMEMGILAKTMTLENILASADKIDETLLSVVQSRDSEWGLSVRHIDVHKVYIA